MAAPYSSRRLRAARRHRRCCGHAAARLAITLATCALHTGAPAPAAVSTTTPLLEPALAHFGLVSAHDALDSRLVAGSTSASFTSDVPWRLELRLAAPFRRVADGLALVPWRTQTSPSGAQAWLTNLEPSIVASGPAGDAPQHVALDWAGFERALAAGLEPGDPPGEYEGVLIARLLDGAGAPLGEGAPLTLRFEIARWIELGGLEEAEFRILLPGGADESESEPVMVTLASNSGWTLLVSSLPGTDPRGADGRPGPAQLLVCADGNTSSSRLAAAGCIVPGGTPQVLAAGAAPRAFDVVREEIPVTVRYHTRPAQGAGSYRLALQFKARAEASPP